MVAILMMSAKLAIIDLLKIKVLWKKDYDVINSADDVTNKILSHDLDYTVGVVMETKIGNSIISMKQDTITSTL